MSRLHELPGILIARLRRRHAQFSTAEPTLNAANSVDQSALRLASSEWTRPLVLDCHISKPTRFGAANYDFSSHMVSLVTPGATGRDASRLESAAIQVADSDLKERVQDVPATVVTFDRSSNPGYAVATVNTQGEATRGLFLLTPVIGAVNESGQAELRDVSGQTKVEVPFGSVLIVLQSEQQGFTEWESALRKEANAENILRWLVGTGPVSQSLREHMKQGAYAAIRVNEGELPSLIKAQQRQRDELSYV